MLLTTLATVTVSDSLAVAATVAPDATVTPAIAKPPPVPKGLPKGIEPLADMVGASSCDPAAKPGTVKLGKLLNATWPGSNRLISRTCGTGVTSVSEHYEGRALDWTKSHRSPKQTKGVNAILHWLFATDRAGHEFANARRLGIMYVIWNNRIWGGYSADQGWRSYHNCAARPARSLDSVCHRNHVHFSLSWAGAMGTTSYWTKTVAAPDFGPCRPADLNWAPQRTRRNPSPCPYYPHVSAPLGASAALQLLTSYSGMVLRVGSRGPVVTAVQTAVGAYPDGDFGPRTAGAVKAFQRRAHVRVTGRVTASTWRALLRVEAAKTAA